MMNSLAENRAVRSVIALALVAFLLNGCIAAELGVALEAESIGVAGTAGTVGESLAAADFTLSDDLVANTTRGLKSGSNAGYLSNAFSDLTEGGQRPAQLHVNQQGIISIPNGPEIARLSGNDIVSYDHRLGFINANDAKIYEYFKDGSSQPIAFMEGFIRENGVELISQDNGSVIRILRPQVTVDVLALRNGQYLVRLANGEIGLIPTAAMEWLSILALGQVVAGCPDSDHQGEIVRRSQEVVRFTHCEKRNGAYVLSTDEGDTIIDAYDVAVVLTGGGIRGVQGNGGQDYLLNSAQTAANSLGTQPGRPTMDFISTSPTPTVLEQSWGGRENPVFVDTPRENREPHFQVDGGRFESREPRVADGQNFQNRERGGEGFQQRPGADQRYEEREGFRRQEGFQGQPYAGQNYSSRRQNYGGGEGRHERGRGGGGRPF